VAKVSAAPGWQRALVVLTGTVVGVVIVACLYWAQKVFIPVALAVFLTFLLAPLAGFLQRRLGRTLSVVLVVLLGMLVLGGIVWLVTAEATSVAGELPKYTENIKEKIQSLRQMGRGPISERLGKMIRDITGDWESPQPSPPWLSHLPALISPVVESLGGLALALVLVVFMLLKREDLPNRLIRLVGQGRITITTKAVDDAGRRISRFLLMQVIVNSGYGTVLAIGLLLIGVPHALLWGFLAAVLRYVPYLGTCMTAVLLMVLSLAIFPGWMQPLLVLGLIVALELAAYNIVEPWLFSQSMGVSAVALLVAAAFWAFLWGPIGLILSSPLTVCLVVLGKYVPQLEFLDVLLGDEPGLDADVSYYQQLLARNQDEATQLVLTRTRTSPPEQVYDELLIPVLNYARRDRERDDLTEADEQFVLRATREILEDLGERQAAASAAEEPRAPASRVLVLGCPGRDEADGLALEMLRQVVDPAQWEVEVLSTELPAAELVALAAEKRPAIICIGALPPGGLAHARYLCKRLRARLPGAKIVVGRWGLRGNVEQNQEQLREAGADLIETTLAQTRDDLNAWLPALADQGARAAADGGTGQGRAAAG
jgi:predicted PurR-regulated permease PerM